MRECGLAGAYAKAGFRAHPDKVNEADLPNIAARGLDGRAPRTHACSDPAYVRVGSKRHYACLLADPRNRETAGHAASDRKDARLVRSALAALGFPISDIGASRADRGSELDNAQAGELLGAFGIERSLSRRGCPYENAAGGPANKIPKAELACRESSSTLRELRAKLSDCVHWHDHFGLHSKLECMSPVEFRKTGLSL